MALVDLVAVVDPMALVAQAVLVHRLVVFLSRHSPREKLKARSEV